jgi:hypothetical protein
MRAAINVTIGCGLASLLAAALGGCDKPKRANPAQSKRQRLACASPSANDHLKNAIFDDAIAARRGDRANLDILADYSVARMENPVVKGWDRSLDITHCKGSFILEVPPGAERALGGERQLRADLDYTAQASADGAGYVYQQKGAEPIIAKLAAFNLGAVAYRPSPAIDEAQGPSEVAEKAPVPQAPQQAQAQPPRAPQQPQAARPAQAPRPPQVTPTRQASVLPRPRSNPSGPPVANSRSRVAERTSTSRTSPPPPARAAGGGEATVRAFYGALGGGNGAAASSQVIPEKRSSGAFSPGAMSRFYGRLPEPIRLTSVVPLSGGSYRVTYRYSAGRSRCNGSAVVKVTDRGGRSLIRSIRALSGC